MLLNFNNYWIISNCHKWLYLCCHQVHSHGRNCDFGIVLRLHIFGAPGSLRSLHRGRNSNYRGIDNSFKNAFYQGISLWALSLQLNMFAQCHRVCEAYYNCDWYKMSKDQQKLIGFSILRSQEPVILRAGKFSIFYLATFTDVWFLLLQFIRTLICQITKIIIFFFQVIKTAMGYLSVLRTVML